MRWLLGFVWKSRHYQETCLPFGLCTATFIFNLFAEAFHWILQSYLQWSVGHYQDDFIAMLPASEATPAKLLEYSRKYNQVTDVLGIPRQESKDQEGTIIPVFGIEINSNTFIASLPPDKIAEAISVTKAALSQRSLTLKEAQSLNGHLSFCTKVVRLGWVFMRPLWTLWPATHKIVALPENVVCH